MQGLTEYLRQLLKCQTLGRSLAFLDFLIRPDGGGLYPVPLEVRTRLPAGAGVRTHALQDAAACAAFEGGGGESGAADG